MKTDYEKWHKTIDNALRQRDQYWNGDRAWKRFIALYRGDHWRTSKYNDSFLEPDSEFPRDRITVNVTISTILLAKSFLVNNHPKFIIEPRPILDSSEVQRAVVSSMLQQEVLNYEWKERNMHFQCKESVLDALVIGHGITKDGFTFKKDTAKNPKKSGDIEQKDFISDESPYVERINPFLFLFDTDHQNYRQLDAGNWVVEIFFRCRDDVLANDRYDDRVLNRIRSGTDSPETVNLGYKYNSTSTFGTETNIDANRDILYQIWDKKYRRVYTLIRGVEGALEDYEWPYDYLDGFPYTKLDFIPVPNEHYGLGIPYIIEDQQLELNRIRTTMFDHRRRFNRKYQVLENMVEQSEVNKLISGETGTIIMVKQQNAIQPVQEGKIPSDSFNVEGVIKSDINELSGVDKLARGGDLPSRTSAAEIEARKQFTNLKLDDRSEDVDVFYTNNGRKVLQHIKSNYRQDKVIKISGIKGQMWVEFSPDDIKGEFDISMETVSAPQVDEVADRQQAIQIFQLIMQNLQFIIQSGLQFNFQELFKWIFEKFGEKDISRFFAAGSPIAGVQPEGQEQPNTALNTMQQQMPQMPQQMTASNLRSQLQGGMAGNLSTNPMPGIQ